MNLNGTDYYYLYNAQGDVIALYDSAGTVVTEYKYDSWGKLLSTTGSAAATIGLLNPLRYRGYFYDTDLGFYLLETRYYDPETGLFINADDVLDNRGANCPNLYAYCLNNPINAVDSDGNFAWAVIAKAVGKVVAGALIGGATGAVIGAVSGYYSAKKLYGKAQAKKGAIVGAKYGARTGAINGALGPFGNGRATTRLAKGTIRAAVCGYGAYKTSKNSRPIKTAKEAAKNNAARFAKSPLYCNSKTVKKIYYSINAGRTTAEVNADIQTGMIGASAGFVGSVFGGASDLAFEGLSNNASNVAAQFGVSTVSDLNNAAFQTGISEIISLFK